MTVNRRALVSVTIGLGLALAGCSRPPTTPIVERSDPSPSPSSRVGVTLSSDASLAPNRLGYVFKFQLVESGGVAATIREVDCEFDVTLGSIGLLGDKLPQNRKVPANGTLDVELTCPSPWGFWDERTAFLVVFLIDDNGHAVSTMTPVVKLPANPD